MTTADEFRQIVSALPGAQAGGTELAILMPQLITDAALAVVGTDGAGLSAGVTIRLPLAASGPEAREAESLQATLGEGPCLTAAAGPTALIADLETIAERWPLYHHELLRRSSFRSTCSLPLFVGWPHRVVLDLYSRDPFGQPFADLDELVNELSPVMAEFIAASLDLDPEEMAVPGWDTTRPASDRMRVWEAIGMVMAEREVTVDTALALLRGHAFRFSLSLDDLAARLGTGQLAIGDLDV